MKIEFTMKQIEIQLLPTLTNLYLEDELEGGECVKLVPLEIEEALRDLLVLATR